MILTTGAAAKRAGVTTTMIKRWIKEGKLSATKEGTNWKIDASELQRFMDARNEANAALPQQIAADGSDVAKAALIEAEAKLEAQQREIWWRDRAIQSLETERDEWRGQAKLLALKAQSVSTQKKKYFSDWEVVAVAVALLVLLAVTAVLAWQR